MEKRYLSCKRTYLNTDNAIASTHTNTIKQHTKYTFGLKVHGLEYTYYEKGTFSNEESYV